MPIRFDRSLRNALALVGPMLFASVALADGQAVIIVEDDAAVPGPVIVVRNDAPGLDLRAALRDEVLSVSAQLRESRDCIRGIALVQEGGEPIAASDTGVPSALLQGLSIGAGLFSIRRSGGSSVPAQSQLAPPQVVQPQPQPTQPQVTQPQLPRGGGPPVQSTAPPGQSTAPPARETGPAQSRGGGRSTGVGIGAGVAIGSMLFDYLRNRCESSLQTRFTLPPGVAPETLTVQVVVGERADPDQMLALQLRLQSADGEWVGVAH